ncbi:hypothetical protein ACI796_02255 [Geodermatophilus sp. SYSU D00525]
MGLADDRAVIETWQPPGRFHLFWFIPLGFDAERLKKSALDACDDAQRLLNPVTRARAELTELRDVVKRLRAIAERKETLQEHIDVLQRAADGEPVHDLADTIAALVDHLRNTRAEVQAGRRKLEEARDRLRPLELESEQVDGLERAAGAQERAVRQLEERVAELRRQILDVTAGDAATRRDLREVHRLVSIRLKYDGRSDVIDDLGGPLEDL